MKRSEITSVGDVLREVLEQNNLDRRLEELKAAELWPRVIGDHIASQTLSPYVNKGVMTIRVADAALRHELSMSRTPITKEINRIMGKEVIKSLIFKG